MLMKQPIHKYVLLQTCIKCVAKVQKLGEIARKACRCQCKMEHEPEQIRAGLCRVGGRGYNRVGKAGRGRAG